LNGEDRLFSAGDSIGKLGVKMHSLNITLYALWDKGIVVTTYFDKDGSDTMELGSVQYYRATSGSNFEYYIKLSDFSKFFETDAYSDYEIVYWRADRAIFSEKQDGKYIYKTIYDCGTTSAAFNTSANYRVNSEVKLWIVMRKKLIISYQAVDESGIGLNFSSELSPDRNCLEGYTIAEKISVSKLTKLNSVKCTDDTKEFKYWAVMVDGKLVEFDLENDVFTTEHFGTGKNVVLYAVFGV